PWIRMRPFLARFSEPVWSRHLASWADFITTTPELEFSAYTTRSHRIPTQAPAPTPPRARPGAHSLAFAWPIATNSASHRVVARGQHSVTIRVGGAVLFATPCFCPAGPCSPAPTR